MLTSSKISIATTDDIAAIVQLLNSAYRGESSKRGWTTEAHLIAGEVRSDAASVQQVMQQERSVFLKYTTEQGRMIGCVNLQQQANKIYLGMFAVSPQLQGAGIGKQLLAAAEVYAQQLHCNCIYMTVIAARTELVNWYIRHGYVDSGQRKPFVEDGLTGKHLQPLQFAVLEKRVSA